MSDRFYKEKVGKGFTIRFLPLPTIIKHVKELDIMRFIITGRNIDITEGLKSAVEEMR